MDRTKARPIPSGRISPRNALIFGLVLAAISLVFSWFINIWAFFLMVFGLFDNIVVYSVWLKRKSQLNIILGGFSGGAPALIGYVAVTTQHIELGLVMAALVFLWIPTHIWSLSLPYQKRLHKGRCANASCNFYRTEVSSNYCSDNVNNGLVQFSSVFF